MAKMIDVTLVGGIINQPTTDTIISINADNINDIKDDTSGNSSSKITMQCGKPVYFVRETRKQLDNIINAKG